MSARITVDYSEEGHAIRLMAGKELESSPSVSGEITYSPGQTRRALAAIDRMADDLKRQIAEAAERHSDE